MVAEEHNDGGVEQPILLQFLDPVADPSVHRGDVVVGAGDRVTHVWRVGVERRQRHIPSRDSLRATARLGKRLALVRSTVIEDREERLVPIAIPPVGRVARCIPDGHGLLKLVVLLGVVCAGVAGGPEPLGKAADKRWRHALIGRYLSRRLLQRIAAAGGGCRAMRVVAHVHRADAGAEHPGDQRRPRWRTDRRGGEGIFIDHALAGEPVEVGRGDCSVAVGTDPGAHVLHGEPDDVRRAAGVGCPRRKPRQEHRQHENNAAEDGSGH